MPPKKDAFTHSINPELYAKAHRPAGTIAMGMKSSHASAHSWTVQVQREEAIRDSWTHKYDPDAKQSAEAVAALERTQARDTARHAAYVNPSTNPEIHALLYKKTPPATTTAASATLSAPADAVESELQSSTPPLTLKDGVPVVAGGDAASRRVRRAAAAYLEARCDNHPLQQRFPNGPATAAQAVGWGAAQAAAAGKSSVATAHTAPHRRSAGAYRKPEDEDHAALLGFDYQVK